MKSRACLQIFLLLLLAFSSAGQQRRAGARINKNQFAREMVDFIPYKTNPVFKGTGADTWDRQIRERGYIIFEKGLYKRFRALRRSI